MEFHNQEYGYINDRLEEYKPISDQLDQLFGQDDGGFGDDSSQWYLDIQKVKTDNP